MTMNFRPGHFCFLQSTARLSLLAVAAVLFTCSFAFCQSKQKTVPGASDRTPNERADRFERPERDQWQKPDEVIKTLGLKNGVVIADIGAGSGYFSRRFAKAVAPEGKVYAVDIDTEILAVLKDKAAKEGIQNIVIDASKPDDPMLPEGAIDIAFFCDSTHHISHRVDFYRTVKRALKPDGRLVIIDYPPEASTNGWVRHKPDELIPVSEAVREAGDAGFKLDKQYNFIERQYFLVFTSK